MPLRAAQYDPATNSVTLIPKRKLTYVDHHRDQWARDEDVVKSRKPIGRPLGLTDLEGNPINAQSQPLTSTTSHAGNPWVTVGRGWNGN